MSAGAGAVVLVVCMLLWCAAFFFVLTQWSDSLSKWRHFAAFAAIAVLTAVPIYFGVNEIAEEDAKPFDGYVYRKTFTPAHTQMVLVGKTMQSEYVAARWNVVLNSYDGKDQRSCDITEAAFDKLNAGDDFHCGGYR